MALDLKALRAAIDVDYVVRDSASQLISRLVDEIHAADEDQLRELADQMSDSNRRLADAVNGYEPQVAPAEEPAPVLRPHGRLIQLDE